MNPINIAVWNANGLAQRTLELKSFLINNNIDIMLIAETHFTEKNFLKIPNYSVHYTNHPDQKAHGGTAVLVKSTISHYEIEKTTHDYLQATSITAEDSNGPITFTAVYCPPRFSINQQTFCDFFKKLGNRFIAGGDYKAKHPWWGSRLPTPNPKGRQLFAAMHKENCLPISTEEPTYWPTDPSRNPDLIDFAVIKGINKNYFTAKSCFDLSSDHSPIIVTYSLQLIAGRKTQHSYNNRTIWSNFKQHIIENLNCKVKLKSPEDIEIEIDKFNSLIHKAASSSTPKTNSYNKKLYLPKNITELITLKRKIRKAWQTYRHPLLKTKLNKLTENLKTLLLAEINNSM